MAVHTPARTAHSALAITPKALAITISVLAVTLGTMAVSIWSPDLVTGSAHEHFQLAVVLGWPMAVLSIGLVLLAGAVSGRSPADASAWVIAGGVAALIWVVVALTSIFGPVLVTGTDPTQVPLATILAPVFGALGTAYAAVYAAGAHG